jgi:uncharacterized protein YdbL (DUF1318 family)
MGSSFMDEELKKGQSKPKTPEEIRAERIANLKDPEARAAIKKIEEERTARLAEINKQQEKIREERVAQLTQMKVNSRNAPQPAPPGMRPEPVLDLLGRKGAENDARADIARWEALQKKAESMPFEKRQDQVLDAAERGQGHALHRDGPDRSAR